MADTLQPTPVPTLGDEAERRAALRRMRAVALGLLVLAALVFLATHLFTDLTGVWGFVGRASEAAMIGAIADWFAVTALFRHPLRLPIPHTAIIPRRKDALGESLSTFVAENFLRADVVEDKIRRTRVTARAGAWLSETKNQEYAADRIAAGLGYALDRIEDRDVMDLATGVIVPKLIEAEKSPVLGDLLGDVVQDGSHHGVVDLIIGEAHTWLSLNPRVIEEMVESRRPSWVPHWLGDQLAGRLHREVLRWVAEVRDDPRHQARIALDAWLLRLAEDLQQDTPTRLKLEELLGTLLSRPETEQAILALWQSFRRSLRRAVDDPGSALRPRLAAIIGDLAQKMSADEDFQARADDRLARTLGDLAQSFGPELASVIGETIARWDAREASRRIELFVGKDLQYIRINGTVIGALVGLAIHAVTLLLP